MHCDCKPRQVGLNHHIFVARHFRFHLVNVRILHLKCEYVARSKSRFACYSHCVVTWCPFVAGGYFSETSWCSRIPPATPRYPVIPIKPQAPKARGLIRISVLDCPVRNNEQSLSPEPRLNGQCWDTVSLLRREWSPRNGRRQGTLRSWRATSNLWYRRVYNHLKNSTTIKRIYNSSANIIEGCNVAFDTNDCYNFLCMVSMIGIGSMVTRARLRYTWDYLTPVICSITKSAAMEKLMPFPAKIHKVIW